MKLTWDHNDTLAVPCNVDCEMRHSLCNDIMAVKEDDCAMRWLCDEILLQRDAVCEMRHVLTR